MSEYKSTYKNMLHFYTLTKNITTRNYTLKIKYLFMQELNLTKDVENITYHNSTPKQSYTD